MSEPDELEEARRECRACLEQLARLTAELATLTETVATKTEAVETRDAFLAMVAHDLRSPLSAITLGTSTLTRMLGALESGTPERAIVRRIQGATTRITRLVDDLLDISALERGAFSIDVRPHEVADLVNEACDQFEPLCVARGLVFGRSVQVAPGSRVSCDRARFFQILSNLVGNSIKFTPSGGGIVVRAQDAVMFVEFAVVDTGCGIAAADLPHVFERDWRGRRVAGQHGSGLGLGLAIVRSLVTAQGGMVSVTSAPGVGSTFSFTLPRLPVAGPTVAGA